MMRCPACNAENPAGTTTCSSCGATLRRPVREGIPLDDPADGGLSTIIPYKNTQALMAYYFGVFSFICFIGLLLAPIAIILGILGLRYAKANPVAHGTGHAIAGIVLGSLSLLAHLGVIALMFLAFLDHR